MASIESLLNPLPTPSPTSSATTIMLCSPRQKKQKMAKDAPIFQRGKPKGEVRYPPCEMRNGEIASLHHDFRIHPFGNIADYPRHIPYNSDKKSFQERTGRESFEVFQYTFQIPGEEKQWTVMWDYNIGLVRITHLFKCNDYSKTTPAKMLNQNPGLRDICHSITGGALAAQGYWMPYEAAKAVAATFCWKIRYALTPIFGVDFPNTCIPPSDSNQFGRMIIEPAIVQIATRNADEYRLLELRASPPDSFQTDYPYRPSSAPGIEKGRTSVALGRHILPKSHQRRHRSNTSTSTDTSLVGYGSSPEEEYYSSAERYYASPVSLPRSSFTPVNTPRSRDIYANDSINLLPSSHGLIASLTTPNERARERAKAKVIPSSVPSNQPTLTTRGLAIRTVAAADGSDANSDADAETDFEYYFGPDPDATSSDESTSSTPSSGSGSSDSVGPIALAALYADDSNIYADADDNGHQDTETDMAEYRPSKRIAIAGHRRERIVPPNPRFHPYGENEDYREPEPLRVHDPDRYSIPGRRPSEIMVAQALMGLRRGSARRPVSSPSGARHDVNGVDDGLEYSHGCPCRCPCHEQDHGDGHHLATLITSGNPPNVSGQKRRRAPSAPPNIRSDRNSCDPAIFDQGHRPHKPCRSIKAQVRSSTV